MILGNPVVYAQWISQLTQSAQQLVQTNPVMAKQMFQMIVQQDQQLNQQLPQLMQTNIPMCQQLMVMMQQREQQIMMFMQQLNKPAMPTPNLTNMSATQLGMNMNASVMGMELGQTQMMPPAAAAPVAPMQQQPMQQQIVQQQPATPQPKQELTEDEEMFVKKEAPKKFVPFKREIGSAVTYDEWTERLPTIPTVEWNKSPVRLIPLTPKNEAAAEELLATRTGKEIVDFGESFIGDAPGEMYSLDFGLPGAQVPVDKDLNQKIIFATADSQKYSFRILKRKYPKYRFTAEPTEGTLSKSAMEIALTLKMSCTTTVELEIPVLIWHGTLKDYDKVAAQSATPGEKPLLFVGYLRGKIRSQLSTRLDIEEIVLYKPPIGSGAFGTVYKGRYRGLDVACKLIKDQENLTQEMFKDFKGEVDMFEKFRHPCIVNFIGAVFFPGSLALVTELCKYGALPSAMKNHPDAWTPQMKIKALYDCAQAMNFLHQSSIVHRDLKPDNLLTLSLEIHSPNVCKLSDFGTTRDDANSIVGMNMTKGIGTPLYMAPEVIRGGGKYSSKVDVYSFGIMMASITDDGKEPYQGDGVIQSSWQFADIVVKGVRPKVLKFAEMPPAFNELRMRCWDGDPNRRPAFEEIVTLFESMLVTDE